MIATPPRSCARWRACASAASPCGGGAAPWACPPSTGGGPAYIGIAVRRRRAWDSSSKRCQSLAWLGARGPAMTVHGAIDDATNTVLALHFRPTEDLHGYAVVFQQLFTHYGVPLAFYGDRINILVRNDSHWSLDEQLRGVQDPTHLGRILHDLGIGYIAAGSPEAKGRVERLWRTLQDRLTSELRLRHITTPEAANAFLPEFLADFNRRFTRTPAEAAPAWRRTPQDLALVLGCRYTRRVARDNTVHLGPRWIQPPARPPPALLRPLSRRAPRELLDGRLVVLHAGAVLATQPAPPYFSLTPHSAPSSDRRHPAQRPTPAPEPLSRERAAPHTAQDQRADPETSSTPPSKPRSARPAARHPWRKAITKKAQALYPVPG